MTPLPEDTVREAFEKWYLSEIGDRLPFEPQHGYYLDDAAQDMWLTWQAAYALVAQAATERAALHEIDTYCTDIFRTMSRDIMDWSEAVETIQYTAQMALRGFT